MSSNWTVFSDKEEVEINLKSENVTILWDMSDEQLKYYVDQFYKIVPKNCFLLEGHIAKEFFELSKLNINDLRNIWELADNDKDGCLSLGEFCVAMHLVVMRKRGVDVPTFLPKELNCYFTFNTNFSVDYVDSKQNPNSSKIPDILKKLPSDSSVKSDSLSLVESLTAFHCEPPMGISNPQAIKLDDSKFSSNFSKPIGPTELLQNENETFVEDEPIVSPPVPPRCNWNRKDLNNINSSSFKFDNLNEPLIRSNVSDRPYGIDFSQSPESIILHLNSIPESETRKEAFNFLINILKMQCDTLTSTNDEMSKNLKELQQQRISLEIQLERMMPIRYN